MSAGTHRSGWRRLTVHPLSLSALLVLAGATCLARTLDPGDTPSVLSAWLVMAIAAGFAISGSV